MKKITRNIATLMLLTVAATAATAQVVEQKVGDNSLIINPNAVLEIESADRGLLLPRLELKATDNFEPLAAHIENMTVYNTAASDATVADENKVTPGYYYNDGAKWVRIATGADAKTEPWKVQDTGAEADDNEQDIYQEGKVAVGFTDADGVSDKQLEVKGDFKAEVAVTGGFTGTEVSMPGLNPEGAMHYWTNADFSTYRVASANNTAATLEAKTGTTISIFAAGSTQSEMSSSNGTNSVSTVRTENTGNFFMESYNVANDFGS